MTTSLLSRRTLLAVGAGVTLGACTRPSPDTTPTALRIGIVPSAPLAVPLIGVTDSPTLAELAVELTTMNNPDEIRATIAAGRVDVATMPIQTAALLANGGLDIQLLVVIHANLLKVLGPEAATWEGLRGHTVTLPFQGDAADLLFQVLAERNGLTPGEDLNLEYATALPDLVTALTQGRATHAVLPEHMATLARRQRPDLTEVLDLADQWRTSTGATGLPASCLVVRREYASRQPEASAALQEHCLLTAPEVVADPTAATAELAELSGAPADLIPELIPRLGVEVVRAEQSRTEVTMLLQTLTETDPRSTGGSVPDGTFFGM